MNSFNPKKSLRLLAFATLIFQFSCSNNQTITPETTSSQVNTKYVNTDSLNKIAEAKFITKAAQSYIKEIKLGELAKENGQSPDVKALANMMIIEHTHSLKDLTTLATKKNYSVPAEADKATDAIYYILKNMHTKEFDKQYCYALESAHNRAITLFEEASEELKDEDIKTMAGKMLTDFDMHLYHIVACLDKLEAKAK